MKAFKKWLKTIALFLSGLILLQSCQVYRKTPVSLEQAHREQTRVKVQTSTDKFQQKYKYITYEEGQFYGVKKTSGELIKIPLNKENIVRILIQNKSASTWVTVAVIAVPIITLTIIILTMDYGFNPGWEGGI